MLEVINGFLIVYFLILCTLSVLLPQLVKPIAACFARPSNEERTVWSQILKLKTEQKGISMKDEFAAYSKLQRQINKLENQLKDNSQTRIIKNNTVRSTVQLVLQAVITGTTIISIFWFRREPVVALKGDLFPLATILRYPSDIPNAISTHFWVAISNFSIRTLLKPVIS